MTKVSGHYVLVKRTIAVLKSHQLHYGDPTVSEKKRERGRGREEMRKEGLGEVVLQCYY